MKRLGIIITAGLFLVISAVMLSFSFAPHLINTQLIPYLLSKNSLDNIDADISYLTLWNLTGSLTVGDSDDLPTIKIPRISAVFSPTGLKSGKIETIQLDGLTVRLIERNGKISLRSIQSSRSSQDYDIEGSSIPAFPVFADLLELRDCMIIIDRGDLPDITLNIQAKVEPTFRKDPSGGYILQKIQAEIISAGTIASTIHAEFQVTGEGPVVHIAANLPDLSNIFPLLASQLTAKLSGGGQLTTEIQLTNNFRAIKKLNAEITLQDLDINSNSFHLVNNPDSPLLLSVSGSGNDFEYSVSGAHLSQPAEATTYLQGRYLLTTGEFTGKGELEVSSLQEDIQVEFKGVANPEQLEAELIFHGKTQNITLQSGKIDLGQYSVKSTVKTVDENILIANTINISNAILKEQKLEVHNITSSLSYTYGEATAKRKGSGKFSIERMHFNGEDVAGISATFIATLNDVDFSGNLTSHMPNQHTLLFSGNVSPDRGITMNFNFPSSALNTYSLPTFISLPPDLDFSGKVNVHGEIFVDTKGKPTGNITVTLNDGELSLEDKKLFTRDINTEIVLAELPALRSSSTHHLKIGAIDFGNLKFTNGNLYFRIHSPTEFFLEKSSFNWCNGKVESGSLNIDTKNPIISTTLYCDRLQFSELLNQFGISETDGDGSLNGRLPIHFTGKEMLFDDGFLFSTPGNSGIVRFNNTAMLRQGMPDMGKAAYLEYSLQAMENFSYNWTKLTFNSIDDDLLIKMQIDGKPESPLPFGYSKGQLVTNDKGPGIQHPIRLDVNFHLPFAQMFKYGQSLQKIMENMQ